MCHFEFEGVWRTCALFKFVTNLTLTCYLNEAAIFKYGGITSYLKLTLKFALNMASILQYGGQARQF